MTADKGITSGGAHALVTVIRRAAGNLITALALVTRPARVHPRAPWFGSRQKLGIAAAAFVAVFLAGMMLVDAATLEAVLRLPRWTVSLFAAITDFGKSGWFLWPLGILFLTLAALPAAPARFSQWVLAALMVRVGFLFLAIGVPGLFVTTIKRMIGRARPLATGHVDPFAFSPFIWRAAYASLPSGHAATAFSVLIALGTLWPRGRAVLVIYALLIAASRVIVMAHYPTDVLAGALVGTLGALMVRRWFALRRLGFSIGPEGRLCLFPGPSVKRIKAVARELLAE